MLDVDVVGVVVVDVVGVFCQMTIASISGFCGQAANWFASVVNEPISYPEY